MAGPAAIVVKDAWDKVTRFLHSQVSDEANRAFNFRIAKAVGLFAGSIWFMRNCGDAIAI